MAEPAAQKQEQTANSSTGHQVSLRPGLSLGRVWELLNTLNDGVLGTGQTLFGLYLGQVDNTVVFPTNKFQINTEQAVDRVPKSSAVKDEVFYSSDIALLLLAIIKRLQQNTDFLELENENDYLDLQAATDNFTQVSNDLDGLKEIVDLLVSLIEKLMGEEPVEEAPAPEKEAATAKVAKPEAEPEKSRAPEIRPETIEEGPYQRRLRDQAAWLQGLALYEFFTQHGIDLGEIPEALRNQILSEAMLLLNGLTPEEIMALVANPVERAKLLQKLMRRLQQNPYFMTRLELFYNTQVELFEKADQESGQNTAESFQNRIVQFVENSFPVRLGVVAYSASIEEQVALRQRLLAELEALAQELEPRQVEELQEVLSLLNRTTGSKNILLLLDESPELKTLLQKLDPTAIAPISEKFANRLRIFVQSIQHQQAIEEQQEGIIGATEEGLQAIFIKLQPAQELRQYAQETQEAEFIEKRQAVRNSFEEQLGNSQVENPNFSRVEIEKALDRLIMSKAPVGFTSTLNWKEFNAFTGLELTRQQFLQIQPQLTELHLVRLHELQQLTGGKVSANTQILNESTVAQLRNDPSIARELQAKVFERVGELDKTVAKVNETIAPIYETNGQKPVLQTAATIAVVASVETDEKLSKAERQEAATSPTGLPELELKKAIVAALRRDREQKKQALEQAPKDQRVIDFQQALLEIGAEEAIFAFSTPQPRVELGLASNIIPFPIEHKVVQSPHELPETHQASPLETAQNLFRRQKPDSVANRAALSTAEAKPRSPIPGAFSRFLRRAKEQRELVEKTTSKAKKQARNRMAAWIAHMFAQFLAWLAQTIMAVAAAIAGAIATFAAVLATGAALLTALAVAGLVAGAVYLGLKYGGQVISAASGAVGDALSWTGRQIKSVWNGAKNTINRALRPSSTAEASVGGGGVLGTTAGQTAVVGGTLGTIALITSIHSPFLQPLPTLTGDEVSPYVEIEKVVVGREEYSQEIADWPTTVHYRVAIKAKDNYTLTIPVSSISDVFRISQNPEPWEDAGLPVPNPSAPSDKGFTDLQTSSGCTGGEPDYSEGNLDNFLSEDESELVIEPGEILLFPSYCYSFDENYNHSNIVNTFSIDFDYDDGAGDSGNESALTEESLCFGDCSVAEFGCFEFAPAGPTPYKYYLEPRIGETVVSIEWSEAEKQTIGEAFARRVGQSDRYLSLLCNRGPINLYRLPDGGKTYGGWAMGSSAIGLYDYGLKAGGSLSVDITEYTLVHESGHLIDYRNAGLRSDFLNSTGYGGCFTYPVRYEDDFGQLTCPAGEPFAEGIVLFANHSTYNYTSYPEGVSDIKNPIIYNWFRDNIYGGCMFELGGFQCP